MGGNGGKWGKQGGNGGKRGEMGENNKNCGARMEGIGPPNSPHFPPFFLRSFHQCNPPPPQALLPIKPLFFDLFSPQMPHFSIEHPKFTPFSPISPHFY